MSITKKELTGSTDGRPVKVVATASAGTTIHTATSSTSAGVYDEIWLWAINMHTADVDFTLQFGGTTSPDDNRQCTLPFKAGDILVCPGWILQNSLVVKAFASVANVVTLVGFVNAIT